MFEVFFLSSLLMFFEIPVCYFFKVMNDLKLLLIR